MFHILGAAAVKGRSLKVILNFTEGSCIPRYEFNLQILFWVLFEFDENCQGSWFKSALNK